MKKAFLLLFVLLAVLTLAAVHHSGMAGDIVIFDEKSVIDRATFQEPKQSPVGIDYVIVNGRLVIEKGNHHGVRSGAILRGRGFQTIAGSAK